MVGRPRSGTKLLRDLLNRHPDVGIPLTETTFYPRITDAMGPFRPRDPAFRAALRARMERSPFWWDLRRQEHPGLATALGQGLRAPDWPGFFEAICRSFATEPGRRVWGAKAPGYLERMERVRRLHPDARFVHIVRDPRDVAASARAAWGSSLRLCGWRWAAGMAAADAATEARLLEVRFEELVADPEAVTRRVCAFAGLSWVPAMVSPGRVTENLGGARGSQTVVRERAGGSALSPTELRTVEEAAWAAAAARGYPPRVAQGPRVPALPERVALAALDRAAHARFHVREKGVVAGLSYAWRVRS